MDNQDLLTRLSFIEQYFLTDSRQTEKLFLLYERGKYQELTRLLDTFPTIESLMNNLLDKLKEKSVYRTLKKICEGKELDKAVALKGLFSLGTHAAIEIEQGRKEYRALLPLIYERIGQLIWN